MATVGLDLGISPPRSIRLWFTIFSGGPTLLRRKQCSGIFQNDFFSSPFQEHEGIFFLIFTNGNLMKFLEVNLIILWGSSVTEFP